MATALEKLEAWGDQVERTIQAGVALKAARKLFAMGGEDAQEAWKLVEQARANYQKAFKREGLRWRSVTGLEPDDGQQDIEGIASQAGPKGKGPSGGKAEGRGPRLLGPGRAAEAGE